MNVNFWILAAAVGVTLLLFLAHKHFSAFNFKTHPCTALAAALMAFSWVMLLLVYSMLHLPFPWALVVTDLGSAALLCAAFILMRGDRHFSGFDAALLIPLLILLVWDYVCGRYASGPGKTLLSVICLSPSLLLAQIAMVVLGWAFVVRWGAYGIIYGVLCVLHAVLQLPVYIALNLSGDFQLTPHDQNQFAQVVDALGLLKLPLAYGFLAFLVSRTRPEFDEPAFMPPDKSVIPDKSVFIPISILLVAVGGNVVTDVIKATLQR